MKTNSFKWSVLTAIVLWGFASFIVLAADEDPTLPQQMPILKFFLIKVIAMISMLLCVLAGKYAGKKGWLPNVEE